MRDNPTAGRAPASTPVLKVQPASTHSAPSYLGRGFGDLRVLSYVGRKSGRAYYRCRCSCGAYRVTSDHKLRSGVARACRECARAESRERARRVARLTPDEIKAKWRLHLDEFTEKQRAAYYRKVFERGGERATDDVRADTVAEVLLEWLRRTEEHMPKGVE